MASVTDIGVPGQPMDDPPLTPWQAAVRDVLNGSDVPVDTRIATAATVTTAAVPPAGGWTGGGSLSRQGKVVILNLNAGKATWANGETCATPVPVGYRPAVLTYGVGVVAGTGSPATLKVQPTGEVQMVLAGGAGSGGVFANITWMTT